MLVENSSDNFIVQFENPVVCKFSPANLINALVNMTEKTTFQHPNKLIIGLYTVQFSSKNHAFWNWVSYMFKANWTLNTISVILSVFHKVHWSFQPPLNWRWKSVCGVGLAVRLQVDNVSSANILTIFFSSYSFMKQPN